MSTVAKKAPATPTSEDFKRIAEAIRKTSASAKTMKASGLSRKAILVLLSSSTGLGQRDISIVLDATEALASWCLTQ